MAFMGINKPDEHYFVSHSRLFSNRCGCGSRVIMQEIVENAVFSVGGWAAEELLGYRTVEEAVSEAVSESYTAFGFDTAGDPDLSNLLYAVGQLNRIGPEEKKALYEIVNESKKHLQAVGGKDALLQHADYLCEYIAGKDSIPVHFFVLQEDLTFMKNSPELKKYFQPDVHIFSLDFLLPRER